MDNDAGIGSGGAVYIYNGPLVTILHSNFTRNQATMGGALYGEVSHVRY